MARQVSHKGAEYAYQTGMSFQDYQAEAQSEIAILRADMDKLRDNLYLMDITSKKTWKFLTAEVRKIKYDVVSHILLGPDQDVTYALIIQYVSKTIYLS